MPEKSGKPSTDDLVIMINEAIHNTQKCAPTAADPITVTAGGGAWTLGNYSNDIIADAAIANPFSIHHVVISNPDTNEDYELLLYAVDTLIACVPFTRTNNFVNSIQVAVATPMLDAGTQVRAKLRDGTGGAICNVKVVYHEH